MVATSFLTTLLLHALAIAIAAKQVLDQKSTVKLPLVRPPSRRQLKSLMKRADGSDFDSDSLATTSNNVSAEFEVYEYIIPVIPVKVCQ